jgi:hypothetical protein
MRDISPTPNITVTIGGQLRIYYAGVTTAGPELDGPSTMTLYASTLMDLSGFAADPIGHERAGGTPAGKLADARAAFHRREFDGLELIGFGIWERRGGSGRNVTFRGRQYAVNGERRSFSLLRTIAHGSAQEHVRDLLLQAYDEHEGEAAAASCLVEICG